MRVLLASVLLACLAGSALAQEAEPDVTVVAPVVIQSREDVIETARQFVQEVGGAPRGNNLARWDPRDHLCVGVVNLAPDYAQALADHVSAVAMAVGLQAGEPGCRPNLLILADSDGDALAQALTDQGMRFFRPDLDDSNLGRAALRRFETSGAPVRWWHVNMASDPDTGGVVPDGGVVGVRNVSRIRQNFEQELVWAIIILDTRRIGSVEFHALADYVAMAALAQFDDRADMSAWDTVMNLFDEEQENRGLRMTQWDLDFIRSLYAARGDGTGTLQSTEIGYAMDDLREARLREDAAEAD